MVPNLILQSHQVSIEMEPPSKEASSSSALAIAAPAFSSADGSGDADRPPPTEDRNDGFMGGSGAVVRQTHTPPKLCSNNGLRSKEVVKMKNDFTSVSDL